MRRLIRSRSVSAPEQRAEPQSAEPYRSGSVLLRAAVSVGLLSTWLVLLFAGWIAGGAVHLLFVAALALFPWRAAVGRGAPAESPQPAAGAPEGGSDEESP